MKQAIGLLFALMFTLFANAESAKSSVNQNLKIQTVSEDQRVLSIDCANILASVEKDSAELTFAYCVENVNSSSIELIDRVSAIQSKPYLFKIKEKWKWSGLSNETNKIKRTNIAEDVTNYRRARDGLMCSNTKK